MSDFYPVALVACLLLLVAVFLSDRRHRRIVTLHRRITMLLNSGRSVRESGKALLQTFCQDSHFDAAVLFVADKQSQSLRAIASWSTESQTSNGFVNAADSLVLSIGSGLPGRAWLSGETVVISDLEQACSPPDLAARNGLRSGLIVPLAWGGEVVAVCELLSRKQARTIAADQQVFESAIRRISPILAHEMEIERLRASESELRAIIDTAADGIVWLDGEGRILIANKAAATLLGYDESEMQGRNVAAFLPDVYKRRFGTALTYYFANTVQGLSGRVSEISGQRKDGSQFPMELSVSRLNHSQHDTYVAMVRDISERKLVEKRLSEFYSTVSHELRSPLSSIRGSLGLIEGGAIGPVSADVLELVQIGKRNCERLVRLINDILDAKKIEAGKLNFNLRPIAPAELIALAVEGMKSFAAEAKVTLLTGSLDNQEVFADCDRVVQVLTNLLSNAIKYSPAESTVTVGTQKAINGSHYLRFIVQDQGAGIESTQLVRLFSDFQQLDGSDSRQQGGTGLGLAISKRLIEGMDGQIGVENAPGAGATFWFELPLANESLFTSRSEGATAAETFSSEADKAPT